MEALQRKLIDVDIAGCPSMAIPGVAWNPFAQDVTMPCVLVVVWEAKLKLLETN